ncbi:hypothetical protein [Limisphaera sp. 4302-co]|uniref:hypothetical protein n=1 Tax=Limisphaera sp. 4302-co TaxID=3400417 RepID=UPI003C181410
MSGKQVPLGPPWDLARWRRVPDFCMIGGGALALLGALLDLREFAHAWLLGFMFWLSIGLGALFLVMVHHLFDAGWSVPIRRQCEHIASLLFPWLLVLWIPVGLLAPRLYAWMTSDPHADHALHAKWPLLTRPAFYLVSLLCFAAWGFFAHRLRQWSLRQDETGEALCTHRMRFYSALGIFVFAVTLTLGAILWMKAMQHQWFSTMYGVYYFAGSVWTTLTTVYVITAVLNRQRVLTHVLHDHQFYFLGTLIFAFTVFYAYIHFSQYFIIWNGNIPEETFWYVIRERGGWFWVGMIIIFGHFFLPFLALLRIDAKSQWWLMGPLMVWAWLMHVVDLGFNIYPVIHPDGWPLGWIWLTAGCWAFMGGLLTKVYLARYASAEPYPVKDPRLIEAMGLYHPLPTQISGGELDQVDDLPDAPPAPERG